MKRDRIVQDPMNVTEIGGLAVENSIICRVVSVTDEIYDRSRPDDQGGQKHSGSQKVPDDIFNSAVGPLRCRIHLRCIRLFPCRSSPTQATLTPSLTPTVASVFSP